LAIFRQRLHAAGSDSVLAAGVSIYTADASVPSDSVHIPDADDGIFPAAFPCGAPATP
jgi:hypothetical protein